MERHDCNFDFIKRRDKSCRRKLARLQPLFVTAALASITLGTRISSAFTLQVPTKHATTPARIPRFMFEEKASFFRRDEEPDEKVTARAKINSDGPNWIERSFAVTGTDEQIKASTVLDYNVGISGKSYQTGPLAERMYATMTQRSKVLQSASENDDEQVQELQRTLKMIAMDCAAKEAVRAALLENGLEMVLQPDEEQVGEWASVDSIRLVRDETSSSLPVQLYDDWEEVVDDWTPGQGFDFVVRQVPAKMRALSLDELLQALDPKGELRKEAENAGMTVPDGTMPQSLEDLASANVQRVNAAPREAVSEQDAFAGDMAKRGYRPIHASALASLNADGTLVHATMMHVMDALVSHGCLIVDLTNGGETFANAKVIDEMWKTTERFFEQADRGELPEEIQGMKTAEEVGSTHAKVGFASYDNGNMQFLETRLARTGQILPSSTEKVLGDAGCTTLRDAYQILASVAKDVTKTVVASCSQEVGAVDGENAVTCATKLVNEIIDDGMPIQTDVEHSEGPVSMSPHRLCRYSNNPQKNAPETLNETREIFGAHTDSTFITVVPVALVPGLEVFDEAAEKWYRPEKAARIYWEEEQKAAGNDANLTSETLKDDSIVPWYSRYAVMMPGELLQVFARSEVLASVHRVVVTQEQPSRLSAPILVRGRPGTIVDIARYVGASMGDRILEQCEGRNINDIYDLMQVQSFQ